MKTGKHIETIKTKIPSYVRIYNELYDEVSSGKYDSNQQLPPETKLAKKYNVSRNTLRQALTVLYEDGLIYNVQGKGNFISPNYSQMNQGIEKLDNILLSAAKTECDEIRVEYNYSPPAKIVQDKLSISASDITFSSNNIYQVNGNPISHSYVEIPCSILSKINVDLNDEDTIKELVTDSIYELSSYAESRLSITNAEENIAESLKIKINSALIFVEEVIHGFDGEPIALCKYYMIPRHYNINFVRKRNGSKISGKL